MENTRNIVKKTIQKESWKPDFSKDLEDYFETVLPGTKVKKPAKLFYDPLRSLSFLQVVSSFLFRWKPVYHEKCISLSDLFNKLLGKHKSTVVDEESMKYFRSELLNLLERGPLSVSNPGGKHDFFFIDAPHLPKVPTEFLQEMEREIIQKFNLENVSGEDTGGESISQEGRNHLNRTWKNLMEQYEEKIKQGSESRHRKEISDSLNLLRIVRRYVVEYLGTHSLSIIEPDFEPSFLNECILGTATTHSICLSVLLEFLCLYREKHGERNLSSHPFMRLLTEMAQPNRGTLSTVGDLIWMNLFYSRWLNHKNEKRNRNFGSLAFLLRNPVFILENIDPYLSSYPEDDLAKNQMILFLCTCSATFRKSLIEGLYSLISHASQNAKTIQNLPLLFPPGIFHFPLSLTQSLNHIVVFILFSVFCALVFKVINRLKKEPLQKENPWKGHESAACWIEFLKNKVRSWVNRFEPIHSYKENESVQNHPQLAQVRDYLENVVKIWEAQAVRYGVLCLLEMKDPVDPPEIVRKNFNPAVLGYYEKELQGLQWPIETLGGQSWFGVNALAVDFPCAAQSEYKTLNRLCKDAELMGTVKKNLGISDDYGLDEIQEESYE
jgi:hypothetical protein